jgi:hypothetical protein
MAVSVFVGTFFVTAVVEDQSGPVTQVPAGTNSASYVVEVENGSTLPHDVEVHCEIPTQSPKLQFSHPTGQSSSWSAKVHKLPSVAKSKDTCPLAAIVLGNDRIQCFEVWYRLNAQFGWTKDRSNLPVAMQITVT